MTRATRTEWATGAMVAACLVTASLVVPTAAGAQEAGEPTADARQAIELPARGRTVVLREMRQMLSALNGVLGALAGGDREAAAEAARSGGTRIAVDSTSAMARRLPEEFMRLGMATHRGFDELARAAEAGVSRDSLLARMEALTARCVSCHAGYRIVIEDGR